MVTGQALPNLSDLGATLEVTAQGLTYVESSRFDTAPLPLQKEEQLHVSHSFGPSIFSKLNETRVNDASINPSRFSVHSKLGDGAFGHVFSAQDHSLNRQVALKQFKGEHIHALNACYNELRFIGRLEHPSVPPVYEAALSEDGHPYIVMKQVDGDTLEQIIMRLKAGDAPTHAKYTFRVRIELIIQLLRVLDNAHTSRILHRDIKPDNIIVCERGELYLMDWGIAEDFDVARDQPELCGTPLYFSPEQARGHSLGIESDLYSVGAVAYELLSLQSSAPKADNLRDFIDKLSTYKPKEVDQTFHEAQGYSPSEFKPPIMKALDRDPQRRHRSAKEMMYKLERALEGDFEIMCPRTMLKASMLRVHKWVDLRLRNILFVYLVLFLVVSLLIGCGVLIGVVFS